MVARIYCGKKLVPEFPAERGKIAKIDFGFWDNLASDFNVIWNYDAEDCDFSIFKETAGVAYGYDAGGDTHTFSGIINLDLPVYANNAAAIVGGLAAGDLYRTNGDPDTVCIVH